MTGFPAQHGQSLEPVDSAFRSRFSFQSGMWWGGGTREWEAGTVVFGSIYWMGELPAGLSKVAASQVALVVKNPPTNAADAKDVGSIPGLERSPGVGKATSSSSLAWAIPWTEDPGPLQLQRIGHTE